MINMSKKLFFFSNSYFFIKYISCTSGINIKNKRLKSVFNIVKNSNENDKVHFIFHYNFLNTNFITLLRSNFFKYSVVVTSSKKSIIRRNVPKIFKGHFNNSSFIISIPSKSISEILFFYNSLKSCSEQFNNSSRFSIFFFSIFKNNINIPIEFFNYFSKNDDIFTICNKNVKIFYFIFTFFHYRKILIFNNTLFKFKNNFLKNGDY